MHNSWGLVSVIAVVLAASGCGHGSSEGTESEVKAERQSVDSLKIEFPAAGAAGLIDPKLVPAGTYKVVEIDTYATGPLNGDTIRAGFRHWMRAPGEPKQGDKVAYGLEGCSSDKGVYFSSELSMPTAITVDADAIWANDISYYWNRAENKQEPVWRLAPNTEGSGTAVFLTMGFLSDSGTFEKTYNDGARMRAALESSGDRLIYFFETKDTSGDALTTRLVYVKTSPVAKPEKAQSMYRKTNTAKISVVTPAAPAKPAVFDEAKEKESLDEIQRLTDEVAQKTGYRFSEYNGHAYALDRAEKMGTDLEAYRLLDDLSGAMYRLLKKYESGTLPELERRYALVLNLTHELTKGM